MKIGIIGAGPSGLFMLKKLVEEGDSGWMIHIFEKSSTAGAGMPYSKAGANEEHITNVSSNEIPHLVISLTDWIKSLDSGTLNRFNINPDTFTEYNVIPRLLFGDYLKAQFKLLQELARNKGIKCIVSFNSEITDISDDRKNRKVCVHLHDENFEFDKVIVCSGHFWPKTNEGVHKGFFDSPYPPAKLQFVIDDTVAIRGSSLTAIDALRTLSREHGTYERTAKGSLRYKLNKGNPNFHIVMHSKRGLLPAVRFHLDESYLGKDLVLNKEDINAEREKNEGFLPLNFVFDRVFKALLKEREPDDYEKIKDMEVEEFVQLVTEKRERTNPFELLRAEYIEAEKSISRRESIHWKELLAVLSFAMNYPAKYFSAEDMLRLQKVLMPLISLVIAFLPQSSAEELIALYEAGVVELLDVGDDSSIELREEGGIFYHYTDEFGTEHREEFPLFIDCIGQPHLPYEEFPFSSLRENEVISPAKLRFRSTVAGMEERNTGNKQVITGEKGQLYLCVPGIAINDHFQVLDKYNAFNDRIYVMAVPFIGGYNPDYSGLDLCDTASSGIIKAIISTKVEAENDSPLKNK